MPANLKSVIKQIEELTKRAEKLRIEEAAKIAHAVKSIKEQMRKHGLTIAHLTAAGTAMKTSVGKSMVKVGNATAKAGSALKANDKRLKVKPKYRNKKGETWAGRGKPPRWMAAELKAGKKKEDFLIK